MSDGVQCCFKRYEKKYLLTPEQYQGVLRGMRPHMQADRYSRYTICNLYYDTDSYQLIRTSLEKPVYKEKLRVRSYGTPGEGDKVFVELKKKFEGVVYKRRAVLDAGEAVRCIDGGEPFREGTQICHEIDYFLQSWHPTAKVVIAYDREAYAGIENSELRITFDTNLRWRDTDLDLRKGSAGKPILPPDMILMEVKIPGTAPLWLARLFGELGIHSSSFSKYGTWYKQTILGHSGLYWDDRAETAPVRRRNEVPARRAAAVSSWRKPSPAAAWAAAFFGKLTPARPRTGTALWTSAAAHRKQREVLHNA